MLLNLGPILAFSRENKGKFALVQWLGRKDFWERIRFSRMQDFMVGQHWKCNLEYLQVMLEDILKIGLDAFKNAFKKKYLKLVEQQEWGQCSGQENSMSKGPLKENQGRKIKVTSLWLPFCYVTPLSHQFHINCYHEKLPTIIFYPIIFLFIHSFIHPFNI